MSIYCLGRASRQRRRATGNGQQHHQQQAPLGGSLGAGLGCALLLAAASDIAGKGSYAVVVTGLGAGLGLRMPLSGRCMPACLPACCLPAACLPACCCVCVPAASRHAAATLRRRGTQRLLRARSQPLTIMERSRWTKLAEESISTALRLAFPGEPQDHTRHFDPSHPAISEVSFSSSGWRLANFWVNRML